MSKKKQQPAASTSKKKSFKDKLSLVIHCHNEKKRIGNLFSTLKDFGQKWNGTIEVVLVDNGSTDDTAAQIEKYIAGSNSTTTQFIRLPENIGKGAALKAGVEKTNGDYILTLDADTAVHPIYLKKWLAKLPNKTFPKDRILVGSRQHKDSEVKVKPLSKFAALIFNFITELFTNLNVPDLQTNFKLYPADIAKSLFSKLKTNGSANNLELLYRAKLSGYGISSMPIKWTNQDHNKSAGFSGGLKRLWGIIKTSMSVNWEYFVISPLKNWKVSPKKGIADPAIFRFLFLLLATILFFAMPIMSDNYGITGDEFVQKNYGEQVLSYYETDGTDQEALNYKDLYNYGGIFDYTAAWLNKYVGGDMDEYRLRHKLNAFVGFLLILFTGFLAKEITGSWTVGFLAMLLTLLSPRIFGHCMNNPKDIPFGAAFTFALLYIIRFVKQLPQPSVKTILMLVIGISAAINVRVGGILLIAYFGLFTGLSYLLRSDLRAKLKDIKHMSTIAMKGMFVVVASYFGGLLFWPYGALAPLTNPLHTLREMTNFSISIRMLYEGEHLWSDQLPWYYIPKWMLIASPVVVLLGALLFFVFLSLRFRKKETLILLFLVFAGIFPVVYAIIKHSSLYDGMRHFLFVYPVLVTLAAYGWYHLANWKKNPGLRWGTIGVVALLAILPASWMIKNHPFQYIYFNELSGGIEHAALNYEMDYWMNSTKQMSEWLVKNDDRIKKGERVDVTTNCYNPVKHYMEGLAPNVKVIYGRYYDRNKHKADYYMYIPRFVNKGHMASGAWPPADVVYEAKVDDVVIGAISKRMAPFEKQAADAEKEKNFGEAIRLYNQEAQARPKNEAAWMGLVRCYQMQQDFPNMKKALDNARTLSDDYNTLHFYYGIYYTNANDKANAKTSFEKAVDLNYKNSAAHYYLASLYGQENNSKKVVSAIEMYDKTGGNIPQAYDMGINAANATGERAKGLYWQAKKAYFQKDYQGSFNLVKQALNLDKTYKPAVDLNKMYEKSFSGK